MKITLVMVSSVDGKTTKWDNPNVHTWTSQEDSDYFFKLLAKQKLIIMGAKTYLAAKKVMKLSPKILRIVLTKSPKHFAKETIKEQLEFTHETPKLLIERLEKKYKHALLLGGSTVNGLFLKDHLVTELWLTLEPKLFGEGRSLVKGFVDKTLELKTIRKLNSKGTVLLKYKIT